MKSLVNITYIKTEMREKQNDDKCRNLGTNGLHSRMRNLLIEGLAIESLKKHRITQIIKLTQ